MVCSWREFVQACAGVGIELAWCCTGVAAAAAVPALMLAARQRLPAPRGWGCYDGDLVARSHFQFVIDSRPQCLELCAN